MKRYFAILALLTVGCLPLEVKKGLDEARADVGRAKVQLASIRDLSSPDYEAAKADLQAAEARLEVVKAEAVQERIQQGLRYVEVGTSIVSPFASMVPFGGSVLSLVAGIVALLKKGPTDGK